MIINPVRGTLGRSTVEIAIKELEKKRVRLARKVEQSSNRGKTSIFGNTLTQTERAIDELQSLLNKGA